MMNNKEFSKELENKTKKFAVKIINLSSKLPNTAEGIVIRRQITKSGTSIGANYREANHARSRPDFKNKIKICESEASETQYWLEVIVEAKMMSWKQVKKDYEEWSELLAIFTSISTKL
jgi:four helix bundle protein